MERPDKQTAIDIQIKHHRTLLDCRGIDRIIQSDLFVEAWGKAKIVQRVECLAYIKNIMPVDLKIWVTQLVVDDLGRLSMKFLRQLASFHRVKNYSRISKSQLVTILKRKGVTSGSKHGNRDSRSSVERDEVISGPRRNPYASDPGAGR